MYIYIHIYQSMQDKKKYTNRKVSETIILPFIIFIIFFFYFLLYFILQKITREIG